MRKRVNIVVTCTKCKRFPLAPGLRKLGPNGEFGNGMTCIPMSSTARLPTTAYSFPSSLASSLLYLEQYCLNCNKRQCRGS